MKILIIEADDRRSLYLEISKYLSSAGHEVYYFIYQNNLYEEVRPFVNKIIKPDDYNQINNEFNCELNFEKFKVAIQSLLDRIYCLNLDVDNTELIDKIEKSYQIIKKIIIDLNIDVLLGDGEAEPFIIAGYEVCKELNIKRYSFNQLSLIPGKSLLLPCGLLESIELFKSKMSKIQCEHDQKVDVDLTINKILKGRKDNSSYFKHANWFYKKKNIVLSLIELLIRIVQLKYNEIIEVISHSKNRDFFLGSRKIIGIKGVIYRLKRNIKCSMIDFYLYFRKFYIINNEKKILVGVQYRPEASSSIMGSKFCSVEYLLSTIKKSYPDYKIVIKDHPLAMGYLRLKTYIKIILSKNILIYDASSMSEEDFDLYIVNTSNLGFHMILNGNENVIVLGEPIYKVINNVDKNGINIFISIYEKYCIDDNFALAREISKKITC